MAAMKSGRLSTESSIARGRFLKRVLLKKFLTTGLYNSVPIAENPSKIAIALKFIWIPVSSPSCQKFFVSPALVKTNAVSSVIMTKKIQNFGLESCLIARRYLSTQIIETMIVEGTQTCHDVLLRIKNEAI